jgi:hypothetical protein
MIEIPTKARFVSQTGLTFVTSGKRSDDRILNTIDSLLDSFHSLDREENADLKKAGRISVLGRLFFATDRWLKIADQGSNPTVNRRRRPSVFEFYQSIVGRLTEDTGVTVNVLPSWLERTFGKDMVAHGVEVDLEHDSAKYLSEEERRQYKLIFKGGLAYQQKWWEDSTDLALANTESRNPGADTPITELFGGYVASISGDFYSGPHNVGALKVGNGRYHSSYLAGNAVLCAGEIRIRDGVVSHINNNSGHYQPNGSNLARAVEALAVEGANIRNLFVKSFAPGVARGERTAELYLNLINNSAEVNRADVARSVLPAAAKSGYELRQMFVYQDVQKERLEFLKSHWTNNGGPLNKPGHGYINRYKCNQCGDARLFWGLMEALIKKAGGISNIQSVVVPPTRAAVRIGSGPSPDVTWRRG